MNKLEKFFNTLSSSSPKLLKKYTTDELTSQIKEYVDFTPYIVKHVYKLLISQNSDDRTNGAQILKSIMFQFKLVTDFKIQFLDKKEEYLGSTGEEFTNIKLSVSEQKRMVKEMTNLEHVNSDLVTEIDFKSDAAVTIKKSKIQDKPIMNVNDFFENLTNNLLNYEWNKRHGAFLAYCAIFESETNGTIEIKVDSSLFLKIYEILKSDKFTDFVEDRATAPVREAAARLLSGIYPRISKNNIIDELIKFLDDEDWQTQYSGLLALTSLKPFVEKKKELCDRLQNLLKCKDEDVKFLAADILIHFYDFCDKQVVYERCLENIKDDEEISVSKVSIISLLNLCKLEIEDVSILYNYFTSPIPDVRKSILKLANSINNESLNFLFAELILIDEKDEIRNEAIEILRSKKLSGDFINHFLKIIGNSLYDPYDANEFVSYDDMYFTKSGVKALGKNIILNNRVELFKLINLNEVEVDCKTNTLIGDVFLKLYNLPKDLHDTTDNDINVKRSKVSHNNYLLHDKFRDLKILPLKELENKLKNPEKLSLHPLGESIFVDFTRWLVVNEYPTITNNMINFYKYESSQKYLEFMTDLITSDYDLNLINLDYFITEAYKNLLLGYENFLTFFKKFGIRIFTHNYYNTILVDDLRYKFFGKTIFFYEPYLNNLIFLYEEAFTNNFVDILKGFLVSISYTEDFIGKMLEQTNLDLIEPLISHIDHSFYPLLVKPLLSLMSTDHQEKASKLFSFIIPRLNFRMKSGISESWISKINEAKKDLECLLDSSKISDYEIKCPTKATLRPYQSDGVKWINFLYTFNLNGILADDMGLGKTIQVLTFICSEIYETDRKVLVICPSSLTGHWKAEIENFFPSVKSACYKRKQVDICDILIVSYDSFRNDHLEFMKDWFYVILDEGHVLRNSNTMLYQRISKLECRRRLILTGTPVHNSVEDLVSLFNLLMPNYLGTVKEIPYMSSRMSDNEINEIHKRLENLNKQILPFILRRLKVDVLTDLPPKIIRDIIVDMGPEQREIYKSIEEKGSLENVDYKNIKFDGLKRTRDLLNASSHISYFKTSTELSCKMKGLEDIINLYGGEDIRNKILIFFQYKTTIDYVINDFKKKFNLKYLRLDGSVPASKRAKIASDFNTGNIPVLFLTTLIGGLGLNLTGADTVIFYEHDWNPFNDLQAMDRAHRIGQKNTVNVFRLIAKESTEERVMDLQSFKVFIASSVVSQQNADIETMNTKDLLERFGK